MWTGERLSQSSLMADDFAVSAAATMLIPNTYWLDRGPFRATHKGQLPCTPNTHLECNMCEDEFMIYTHELVFRVSHPSLCVYSCCTTDWKGTQSKVWYMLVVSFYHQKIQNGETNAHGMHIWTKLNICTRGEFMRLLRGEYIINVAVVAVRRLVNEWPGESEEIIRNVRKV